MTVRLMATSSGVAWTEIIRYGGLSYPGRIALAANNVTEFSEDKDGTHRYLTATPIQIERVREALVQMVSSPPQ